MFEQRLKEISRKMGEEGLGDYFILTHKKHGREIYFQNNKGVEFLNNKLNSNLKKFKKIKRIIFFLIKMRILPLFLKKIKLSNKFGEVISIGEQIKGFDLNGGFVYSFPLKEEEREFFIKKKKIRKEIAKINFAPGIIELDKEIPYTKEELFKDYKGEDNIGIFKKLMKFYKLKGRREVFLKDYIKILNKEAKEVGVRNLLLENILKELVKYNKTIILVTLHGDFAKENILIDKKNEAVFIDWKPYEGVIIEDLINFFREEEDLLKNKEFLKILKEVFPKEVQKNIKIYIALSEISLIIKGKACALSMDRIKKYSNFLFFPKH